MIETSVKVRDKLDSIKEKWCRRYSHSLRRDYISTLSEGLNGAVKRLSPNKTQVQLMKEFLKQSRRAYIDCCEEARTIPDTKFMPLVDRYHEIDKKVSQYLEVKKEGSKYKVYYGDEKIATVMKVEGKYRCTCNQLYDPGAICPHTLAVDDVSEEDYVHNMWKTCIFKETFSLLPPKLPISKNNKNHLNENQKVLISTIKGTKMISDETTSKIIELLGVNCKK